MKFQKITINIPADFDPDEFPDFPLLVGRGADGRGTNIEAWNKAERERQERVEARRLAAEAENLAKPQAAE